MRRHYIVAYHSRGVFVKYGAVPDGADVPVGDAAGLTTDGAYDGSNIATDFNRGTRNTYYLDLAKKAAVKCMEGPYSLMDNYGDLFDVKTWNNNRELLPSYAPSVVSPAMDR